MLLAVDIGNSNIKFGVYNLDNVTSPVYSFSISSECIRTSDEYELLIHQFLSSKKLEHSVDCSAISTVVPSITLPVKRAVACITNSKPFIIGSGTRTGFKIRIDNPSEFGADMVCNTAAALNDANVPIIIADLGTATTICAVNRNRELIGSVIIPGAGLSIRTLTQSAELINNIAINKPEKLIGTNTADSITSGVINGNIYMIDGFIRNFREQICNDGEKPTLIATGGNSKLIIPGCRNKFKIIDNLTLNGTAVLYKYNLR